MQSTVWIIVNVFSIKHEFHLIRNLSFATIFTGASSNDNVHLYNLKPHIIRKFNSLVDFEEWNSHKFSIILFKRQRILHTSKYIQ